ncbi:unnamed protein product, partial [marine sediment metagenome]
SQILYGQNGATYDADMDDLMIIAQELNNFRQGLGTIIGDADLSDYVDDDDLSLMLTNWNASTDYFNFGDFDSSGYIDDDDLSLILTNWNAGSAGSAATPEPATMSLLALGALAVLRRRK